MAYSKTFREGFEDAVAKLRWRVETHLRSHLLPHPEESPATRGELSKTLVVLTDCVENFVTEVTNYLEAEVGSPAAASKAPAARPRAGKARARAGAGRRAGQARRRR